LRCVRKIWEEMSGARDVIASGAATWQSQSEG
jgi:hypothetical protein